MKKTSWLKLSTLSLALGLAACSSSPEKGADIADNRDYPAWVDLIREFLASKDHVVRRNTLTFRGGRRSAL